MFLWLLLILAPGRQPAGALPKALLLLKPPWSTAFEGETVTLFCKDHHSLAWEYVSWYHNETPLRKQSGRLQISKSGHYRCKTQRSSLSDPVHVQFLPDWLVLQASHPAFERDKVVLRCRGKEEEDIMERTYYKNEEKIGSSYNSNITVYPAFNDDSTYRCTASGMYILGMSWTETSRPLKIQVQELFPSPVLTASPSWPIEGSPVTLTCETWLPPLTSHTRLQFCFFKEHRALGAGWSNSPELQIPTMWSEGAASYWCQARTVIPRILKTSPRSQIRVHRVPVSDVNLETQPPVGQLIEGEDLVLICSVAAGTGTVTFSWHREGSERSLGRKTQNALSAELRIASVREQDAGRYYCAADNLDGPVLSKRIRITPRVPVSRPILTIRRPRSQAVEGDVVELYCGAWKGSPPILYRFYHEDNALGSSWVYNRGGASFKLPLSAEHSGKYACEADNGLGAWRSETVSLDVKVPASRPVLTVRTPRAQAVEGDVVELRCEAQRGSPPILYRFYHEDNALGSSRVHNREGASFKLPLSAEHSGKYACEADNGLGARRSETVSLNVTVPASRPVLTVRTPRAQAVEGDVVELRCEAQRGSPPILYRFYHEDNALGSSRVHNREGASFKLPLSAEHSGKYACEADNGLGARRSETVSLNVTVPASRPVLTVRTPRAQAVEGDVVELRCEAQRGSPPILYQFYREDVPLRSSSAPSGGGTSFYLSLTTEHSGNYSCEANNGLGAQRSEVVSLSVIVPASHPTLTLRAPGAQAKVGDMVELHCEAQRGSPPILYRFYHEDVPLGNSSAPSGGGASLNLSLTAEHSGNYSCEADNGLGARRSEAVPLSMSGLTGSRSGPIATGVTGGLFSTLGFGVVALLLYCRLPRKAGGRPTSDPSRSPSDSDVREPIYHNAPAWLELQPVYSNVNPKGGEVVYSEVQRIPQGSRPAANPDSVLGLLRTHLPSHGQAASHRPSDPPGSSVIYSQVKVA
ncbi:Fc receptor-like protein 5 isoform X4 [Panthera onca]